MSSSLSFLISVPIIFKILRIKIWKILTVLIFLRVKWYFVIFQIIVTLKIFDDYNRKHILVTLSCYQKWLNTFGSCIPKEQLLIRPCLKALCIMQLSLGNVHENFIVLWLHDIAINYWSANAICDLIAFIRYFGWFGLQNEDNFERPTKGSNVASALFTRAISLKMRMRNNTFKCSCEVLTVFHHNPDLI